MPLDAMHEELLLLISQWQREALLKLCERRMQEQQGEAFDGQD